MSTQHERTGPDGTMLWMLFFMAAGLVVMNVFSGIVAEATALVLVIIGATMTLRWIIRKRWPKDRASVPEVIDLRCDSTWPAGSRNVVVRCR